MSGFANIIVAAVLATQAPPAFRKDYATLEITKNNTLAQTQAKIAGGAGTYYLGFRHSLSDAWLMGIGVHFKDFVNQADGTGLAFFTITHEAYHLIRLYHPTYLMVGPKILYMLPTQNAGYPLKREPDRSAEIGVAFSIGLLRQVTPRMFVSMRVDRWRGTKTNHYHGTEVAAGMTYSLR